MKFMKSVREDIFLDMMFVSCNFIWMLSVY
jgi:hypothetical protein